MEREIKDVIIKRFSRGMADRIVWYIVGPAIFMGILALVLRGISGIPEPNVGSGGVGLKILQDLQAKENSPQVYQHYPTGISFPFYVGGMKRGEFFDYEKDSKGLGIGFRYQGSPLIWANIYVYNLGLMSIPTNIHSEIVIDHFVHLEKELFAMEVAGSYASMQKLGEPAGLSNANSILQMLSSHYSYIIPTASTAVLSHLYLGVYKNHFVKIRFSYQKEQRLEGKEMLSMFLDETAQFIIPGNAVREQFRRSAPPTNTSSSL